MNNEDIYNAIIFSAKHVGAWDEQLSKQLRSGKQMKLYLDIPALVEALRGMSTTSQADSEEQQVLGKASLSKT